MSTKKKLARLLIGLWICWGFVTAESVMCTMEYKPVCWMDYVTYGNSCIATNQHNVTVAYNWQCRTSTQTKVKKAWTDILDGYFIRKNISSIETKWDFLHKMLIKIDKIAVDLDSKSFNMEVMKAVSNETQLYLKRNVYDIYIIDHIDAITNEQPVLWWKWFVTNIKRTNPNIAKVTYEDWHIQNSISVYITMKDWEIFYTKYLDLLTEFDNEYAGVNVLANDIARAIKYKDFKFIEKAIYPWDKLIFSPYVYVEENNIKILWSELYSTMNLGKTIHWWSYDGSWLPIILTFKDYYNMFVYDFDYYNNSKVIYWSTAQRWNTTNNIKEKFPDSYVVEFYHQPKEWEYEMSRSSLNLVFVKKWNTYYLKAIVHDQWTI